MLVFQILFASVSSLNVFTLRGDANVFYKLHLIGISVLPPPTLHSSQVFTLLSSCCYLGPEHRRCEDPIVTEGIIIIRARAPKVRGPYCN